MSTHRVEIPFAFDDMAGHSVEHLNAITAELLEIGVSGGVLFDRARGRAALVLDVEADDQVDAVQLAFTAARTAIHAAGGATPGWERMAARAVEDLEF